MAKRMAFVLLFAVLSVALGAPAPAPGPIAVYQRPLNADCVPILNGSQSASAGGINFFPRDFNIGGQTANSANNRVTVTVAQDFSVEYFNNYKVVTNSLVNETYVLYQCGTPAPSSLPAGAKLFSVPLTGVAALETIPVAFLSQLGVMSRVQSVSSYAANACGQKLLSCGKAATVSTLSLNASALQAQVAPYSDGAIVSSKYPDALTSFAFSAASDTGPLKRAEWFKFLGLFFNLDAVSTQLFDTINSSYYQTKASIKPATKQPVLAFVSLYTYPPDTAFEVSLAAYKVQYTQDAGGVAPDKSQLLNVSNTILSPFDLTNSTVWFAWNRTTGGFPSRAAATSAFKQFLQGVDIVVDETFALDPTAYTYETFLSNMNLTGSDTLSFITNNAVFREDGLVSPAPSYGLDWFEGAIARPDQVLEDFGRAVNPTQFESYKPRWIRNLAEGENVTVVSAQDCSQVASCSAEPTPICPFIRQCSNGSFTAQQVCSLVYVKRGSAWYLQTRWQPRPANP